MMMSILMMMMMMMMIVMMNIKFECIGFMMILPVYLEKILKDFSTAIIP
jgi:hypothetical protein